MKGPLCGDRNAYPALHRDPAGTRFRNAMCLPREAQPCSRMAVLSAAGNNHSSPGLFLTSFLFTGLLLPEKQTLNLQTTWVSDGFASVFRAGWSPLPTGH